jgi:hypothetical protein
MSGADKAPDGKKDATMAKAKRVSEWRTLGELFIHAYTVIGCEGRVIHEVYEPIAGHSVTMTGPGPSFPRLGKLTSRPVPDAIDAIPVGQVRWDRLDAWRAGMNAESWAAIVSVFPEAAKGHRDHFGQIEVTL